MDQSLVFHTEISRGIVEGSVAAVSTQRAPEGFTVYRVVFKVLSQTPEGIPVIKECETWKRFSDLQLLHKHLESVHLRSQPTSNLPELVRAKYFERFKESVIKERCESANTLLQCASSVPHLSNSLPLTHFLSGATIVRIVPADFDPGYSISMDNDQWKGPTTAPSGHFTHPGVGSNGTAVHRRAAHGDVEPHWTEPDRSGNPRPTTHERQEMTDHQTMSPEPLFSLGLGDEGHGRYPEGVDTDLLVVPQPVSRASTASSVTSSQENLADSDLEAALEPKLTRVGSVQVTEWGLEHLLKLREEEEEETHPPVGEGKPGQPHSIRQAEDMSLAEGDRTREPFHEGLSSSESSGQPSPEKAAGAGVPKRNTSLQDSLKFLSFDTPLPSAQAEGVARGTDGGMDWWAQALAETQNVTDNFDNLDALVEANESKVHGNVTPSETAGVASQLTGRQSRTSPSEPTGAHLSGNKHYGGQTTLGVAPKPEDTLSGLQDASGYSVIPSHSRSRSRQDRSDHTSDAATLRTGGKPLSDQSKSSSMDSLSSLGKGRSKGSRSPSPAASSKKQPSPFPTGKAAYILQAGRLIRKGLEYEQSQEYEEAFDLFKAGVDVLLNGVQTDGNKQRRDLVRRKTAEYLKHAEELHQTFLAHGQQRESEAPVLDPEVTSSPAPAPAPAPKPHLLSDFKVIGIIGKVILVESKHTGQTYIFKVLYKAHKVNTRAGREGSKESLNRSILPCPHMVRLLHHYQTASRIYLLLDHVKGGRLVDFVSVKREQWEKLKRAALTPHPRSALVSKGQTREDPHPLEAGEHKSKEDELLGRSSSPVEESQEDEMERMLMELTDIVPPSDLPAPTSTQDLENHREGSESEVSEESLGRLALMRRQLEEEMTIGTEEQSKPNYHLLRGKDTTADQSSPEQSLTNEGRSTAIHIEPPTPTTPTEGSAIPHLPSDRAATTVESLAVTDATQTHGSAANTTNTAGSTPPSDTTPARDVPSGETKAASSGKSSPCFTPSSLRNSPEVGRSAVDDWSRRLEGTVRQWAAQMVLAIDHLHGQGVVCRDLHPNNVLLDAAGQAVLTYFGNWDKVEHQENYEFVEKLYVAPELQGLVEPSPAADWWSLGAILFEILTGTLLVECHPEGIHSHIPLRFPAVLSPEAQSLISQLLQVNPSERLGCGLSGVEEIKAHPFFDGVRWTAS